MSFIDYAWLIPVLPALAALLITFFGRFTPEKGGFIALALVGLASVLAILVFLDARAGAILFTTLPGGPLPMAFAETSTFEWWSVGPYSIVFGVFVDNLTAFMLFVVGILVTLIVLYSIGYMHEEGTGRRRYYAEISLFIAGMLGLVVANNYLMLFIFWEIMGLCSYLLIGYWFAKPAAAAAAKKAFLVTRIGDMFLLIGLGILLVQFGTLDFSKLFAMTVPEGELWILGLANACILLGAVGKSAQFPLHVWLPDAMEGPTTVSALIHAATMVKAGVYLIARSYPLLVQTPEVLIGAAVIGGFTALFAATMALTNWDLKRVLAYSTLSQLGYMFLGLGVAGAVGVGQAGFTVIVYLALVFGIFHLFAHAFFKAGLFLAAGSVGHAVHTYDMRAMGGLRKHMPVTAITMLVGSLSIAGFPLFAGFYSKEGLLLAVFEAGSHNVIYYVLFGIGLLTAFLTAYYMFRLYFLTFEGPYRGDRWAEARSGAESLGRPGHHAGPGHSLEHPAHHLHESPPTMTVPLGILAVFAILGSILVFAMLPNGISFVAGPLYEAAIAEDSGLAWHGLADAITHPFVVPMSYVAIATSLAGIALAWFLWRPGSAAGRLYPDEEAEGITRVLANRWYFDHAYNAFAARGVYGLAKVTSWFDTYVIDGSVNGTAWVMGRVGRAWRRSQTGNVQDYAMVLLAGLVLLILSVVYGVQLLNFLHDMNLLPAFLGGGAQ